MAGMPLAILVPTISSFSCQSLLSSSSANLFGVALNRIIPRGGQTAVEAGISNPE